MEPLSGCDDLSGIRLKFYSILNSAKRIGMLDEPWV